MKPVKIRDMKISEKYSWIFSASTNQYDNFKHFSFQIGKFDKSKAMTHLKKGNAITISREILPIEGEVAWEIFSN